LIRAFSKRKGEARTVMVSEKLIQELKAFRGTTNNSAYVSPYYDRDLDVDEQQNKFFRHFTSLCKRNNLVFAGNKMKVRQFRASTAQWLLNEGVSEQYVSSYLGHSHLYTNSQTILDKRTKDIRKLKRIKLFK
jgi:integrase